MFLGILVDAHSPTHISNDPSYNFEFFISGGQQKWSSIFSFTSFFHLLITGPNQNFLLGDVSNIESLNLRMWCQLTSSHAEAKQRLPTRWLCRYSLVMQFRKLLRITPLQLRLIRWCCLSIFRVSLMQYGFHTMLFGDFSRLTNVIQFSLVLHNVQSEWTYIFNKVIW